MLGAARKNEGRRYFLAAHAVEVAAIWRKRAGVQAFTHGKTNAERHRLSVERKGTPESCGCGCGVLAKAGRRFITGHNARGNTRKYSARTMAAFRANGKRSAIKMLAGVRASGWYTKQNRYSPEQKAKFSASAKLAVKEGRLDPAANIQKAWANLPLDSSMIQGRRRTLHKCGKFVSAKMGCTFNFESSWEEARMQTLEADANVVEYRRTPVRIKYTHGRARVYFPDFLVRMSDGTVFIEEVKPLNLMRYALNVAKVRALRRFCAVAGYVCRVLTTLEMCKENPKYASA